jgi:hypothetical protein
MPTYSSSRIRRLASGAAWFAAVVAVCMPAAACTGLQPSSRGSTARAAPVPTSPQATPRATPSGVTVGFPDPVRTPGSTNPAVTQANISSTICRSGWTATVRPSASYTTALKRSQLASGYALAGDMRTADYEEDHLVPLEVGGNPTDARNLWPEPRSGTGDAGDKDRLENAVNRLVCSGHLTLAAGQQMFESNWVAAAHRLGLSR